LITPLKSERDIRKLDVVIQSRFRALFHL